MGHLTTLFAAAILRGLVAKTAGLALEAWLETRFPALPHLICVVIALLLAVMAVEALALGVEWMMGRFGKHE